MGPLFCVAAYGAVRDADIQANADRYLRETVAYLGTSQPWPVMREAMMWYWPRIIVQVTPARVLWWPSAAKTDRAPMSWEAATDLQFPKSDPAPSGPVTAPASWAIGEWRQKAAEVLEQALPGHLTICDDEGFPLPFRTRAVAAAEEGFSLDLPSGAPWVCRGKATLSFLGRTTFVGDVEPSADGAHFIIERVLPDFVSMVTSNIGIPDDARTALIGRLQGELARRGQSFPQIPDQRPDPTARSLERASLLSH